MRVTAFFTALCATAASVNAVNVSSQLAALTRSNPALASSLLNANPTSVFHSADAALKSLSKYAATATGALGSSLRAEETALASIVSNARQSYSQYAGMTAGTSGGAQPTGVPQTTGGSGSGSGSGSGASSSAGAAGASSSSVGFAAATGVPVLAAGALAALALL